MDIIDAIAVDQVIRESSDEFELTQHHSVDHVYIGHSNVEQSLLEFDSILIVDSTRKSTLTENCQDKSLTDSKVKPSRTIETGRVLSKSTTRFSSTFAFEITKISSTCLFNLSEN